MQILPSAGFLIALYRPIVPLYYLAILLFWKVGLGIGDGDGDGFGRTFNVVEDESDGNGVDDVLVESFNICLGGPGAGEEGGGLGEALRSVGGVLDLDFIWLSEVIF